MGHKSGVTLYQMLAGKSPFIADTWPEDKAAELRACATVHYRDR